VKFAAYILALAELAGAGTLLVLVVQACGRILGWLA
jgi:hypothetical protein